MFYKTEGENNHKERIELWEGFALRERMIALLLALLLLSSMMLHVTAADNTPSRAIHVVFDDSGSMFSDRGALLDRWCQAKYALEVFAAMLGPKDSMNVYLMSDYYQKGIGAPPRLRLLGANDVEKNTSDVHDMVLAGEGTPFASVEKAYQDFAGVEPGTEKWLVVLTDGAVRDNSDQEISRDSKDQFFQEVSASGINVMYLLIMGEDDWGITNDPGKKIFYDKVKSNDQIPSKITEICQRIFNRQKITDLSYEIDVPMSELIVFAQGTNVKVNGITSNGVSIGDNANVVSVRYSEQRPPEYANSPHAPNLVGQVVTYKNENGFDVGNYKFDVSDYGTFEIYYTPHIDIQTYLSDSAGNEVTDMDKLESGEYIINFGFVNKSTKEKVPSSDLLNPVVFSAAITNSGVRNEYKSGDSIKIEEGELIIEARASYMEYNSVVAPNRTYTIYKNKEVVFQVQENPNYKILDNGFENGNQPIVIKATLDGAEFTPEQWTEIAVPVVTPLGGAKLGDYKVEKSDEPGIFKIYPNVYKDDPRSHSAGVSEIRIHCSQIVGDSTWSGETQATTQIDNGLSFLYEYGPLIITISAAVLLLLLIVWIMTRKVYPRKFRVAEVAFVVNRREMTVHDIKNCCRWNVKRGFLGRLIHLFVSEKQASITIDKPSGFNEPNLRCSTTVQVRPASRRITPSKRRKFEICAPIAAHANVKEVQIGATYERHVDGRVLVPTSDVERDLKNVKISKQTEFNRVELAIGNVSRLEVRMRKS